MKIVFQLLLDGGANQIVALCSGVPVVKKQLRAIARLVSTRCGESVTKINKMTVALLGYPVDFMIGGRIITVIARVID